MFSIYCTHLLIYWAKGPPGLRGQAGGGIRPRVRGPPFFEDFSHWFLDVVFSGLTLKFNELWLPFGIHFG